MKTNIEKLNIDILAENQFLVSPLGLTKEIIKQSIEYSINSIEDKGGYMVSVYVALSAMNDLRSQMQERIDELEKYADHLEDCKLRYRSKTTENVCACGLDELLQKNIC